MEVLIIFSLICFVALTFVVFGFLLRNILTEHRRICDELKNILETLETHGHEELIELENNISNINDSLGNAKEDIVQLFSALNTRTKRKL